MIWGEHDTPCGEACHANPRGVEKELLEGLTMDDILPTPVERWASRSRAIWNEVERELGLGWSGKLEDARRLAGERGFSFKVARLAAELGAPVGQLFTVATVRVRQYNWRA